MIISRYIGDDTLRGCNQNIVMNPAGVSSKLCLAEVEYGLYDITCLAERSEIALEAVGLILYDL